jgi:hypothetical protein
MTLAAMWIVGGMLIVFALWLVVEFMDRREAPLLIRNIVTLVLGVYAALFLFDAVRRERLSTEREWEKCAAWCEGVLAEGTVDILQVEAHDAVSVEWWDNLMEEAFFLDLGDDTALFLCGDYLGEAVSAEQFPCARFDLIRYPGETEIRAVECKGEPFATERRLDWEAIEEGYIPSDGEVLPVSLSTLSEDLKSLEGVPGSD